MLQDLYPAWAEQGTEWIAAHGQDSVTHNQTSAAHAAPAPQDLMLSPEQLQLVTDYFQKASKATTSYTQLCIPLQNLGWCLQY